MKCDYCGYDNSSEQWLEIDGEWVRNEHYGENSGKCEGCGEPLR